MSPRPTPCRCIAVLFLGAFSVAALAQPEQRILTGTVTDRHREPLAGAVVQVHDEITQTVVSYITNRSGRYTFQHLSSDDDYTVFATYQDQRSKTRRLSKFDSRPYRTIRLVIKLH